MKNDKYYWETNYSDPDVIDGIFNAKEHVAYIKSIFALEDIPLKSFLDIGFGLGEILKNIDSSFHPYKLIAIEPSKWAYDEFLQKKFNFTATKVKLYNESLNKWLERRDKINSIFDLGICNSVFQYLSEDELKFAIPLLSRRLRYLYLTVPTNVEFERVKKDFDFVDPYAFSRSREFYLTLLRPHFTFVSSRLLESKFHYNEDNTYFMEYLFRQ